MKITPPSANVKIALVYFFDLAKDTAEHPGIAADVHVRALRPERGRQT
jgi:hypothetical protein